MLPVATISSEVNMPEKCGKKSIIFCDIRHDI